MSFRFRRSGLGARRRCRLRRWIVLVVVPGIAKIHARAELARFGQLGEFGRNRALTCGKIRRASVVVNSFSNKTNPANGLDWRERSCAKIRGQLTNIEPRSCFINTDGFQIQRRPLGPVLSATLLKSLQRKQIETNRSILSFNLGCLFS